MTQNQIAFYTAKQNAENAKRVNEETVRHNRATEWESNRANLAGEEIRRVSNLISQQSVDETKRANMARETETNRSNLVHENLSQQQIDETKRSNYMRESETLRSNLAREKETYRANTAREWEEYRSNTARETENERSNKEREYLSTLQLNETKRANSTDELIRALTYAQNERKFDWQKIYDEYYAALQGIDRELAIDKLEWDNSKYFVNSAGNVAKFVGGLFGGSKIGK